jgi:hypothetical protein
MMAKMDKAPLAMLCDPASFILGLGARRAIVAAHGPMIRRLLVGALVLAAAPASGQSTNTQCVWIGGTLNCDTRTSPTLDTSIPLRAGQGGLDLAAMAAAQAAARQQQERQVQEQQVQRYDDRPAVLTELRVAVARRLRAGDCGGAESLALENGEIALATEVREYCATKAQSAQAPQPADAPPEPRPALENTHVQCITCRR